MKRLFKLFILIILFATVPVYAKEVRQCDRADMENYGVNKKWQITQNNLRNVNNTPCVDAKDKIYDFSDVLTDEEEDELREKINAFIDKYNTDLVIVIKSLPYVNDKQNEDFAADFYDYNDFGIDYPLYDGILLFRNTYEADPYYDMYTFGNAQLYFDQSRYDVILDGIYYELHDGKYLRGFSSFISYVDRYMDKGTPSSADNYYIDDDGYAQEKKYGIFETDSTKMLPYPQIMLGSGVVTLIVMLILVAKNKMVKKAYDANPYLVKNSINYIEKKDEFISSHTTSWTEPEHTSSYGGSSGGGGFHSSGGSSGGGHSSGGGRHG